MDMHVYCTRANDECPLPHTSQVASSDITMFDGNPKYSNYYSYMKLTPLILLSGIGIISPVTSYDCTTLECTKFWPEIH